MGESWHPERESEYIRSIKCFYPEDVRQYQETGLQMGSNKTKVTDVKGRPE